MEPKIWYVGGYVRDKILGKDSKDIDFSFVSPNHSDSASSGFSFMEEYMISKGFQIFLKTPEMQTIRAKFPVNHVNAGLVADFVLARKEIDYTPGTREPVVVTGTIDDDLIRRDFCCNAIAMDMDGMYYDPFNGIEDCHRKILRTPTDPEVTLHQDPLRVLRAFRFALTKGFVFDSSLQRAIQDPSLLQKIHETVSQERVFEELKRMFAHDTCKTLTMIHEYSIFHKICMDFFSESWWLMPTNKEKRK